LIFAGACINLARKKTVLLKRAFAFNINPEDLFYFFKLTTAQ
jgi:hypothetical protein